MNTSLRFCCIAFATAAFFAPSASASAIPLAQPSIKASAKMNLLALKINLPKPPSRGVPGNSGRGGGSRTCLKLAKQYPKEQAILNKLVALIPEYQSEQVTQVWGTTTTEYPTFWFYVPYATNSIRSLEFVLQDDNGKTLHKLPVAVPKVPGIVGVTLPSNKPGLQADNQYNWFFKVRGDCGDSLEFVEGWVERTKLDAATSERLKNASDQEQLSIYAEQGLWYDALTTLAQQHHTNPKDATVMTDWKGLLKEVGLEPLAEQAITMPN